MLYTTPTAVIPGRDEVANPESMPTREMDSLMCNCTSEFALRDAPE
jgi:hypothetical protein